MNSKHCSLITSATTLTVAVVWGHEPPKTGERGSPGGIENVVTRAVDSPKGRGGVAGAHLWAGCSGLTDFYWP